MTREMGSPTHICNKRRRTREGPEPAFVCKHCSCPGWHTQGRKGELTSCRGTVWSKCQKPPVRRKGGRTRLRARVSGRNVVRSTARPHLSWKCAQVTGKAGENGQYSGELGGSSPSTKPSPPGCGDTLKAPVGG